MLFLNKETVEKDIQKAKINGYFDSLKDFYKRVPITKCNGCGECCKDSPEISYSEFLYIYDYVKNKFDTETKRRLLIKAIRTHMYGLLKPGRNCCFLDNNKRCLIYERAPMSCKSWGLYSVEEYNKNIAYDEIFNNQFTNHYEENGISISDEIINFRIAYCDNVSVCEENSAGFDFNKFSEYGLKKIAQTNKIFSDKQMRGCSIGDYLAYVVLGRKAYDDRLLLTRKYQTGEYSAIDEYINQLRVEELVI